VNRWMNNPQYLAQVGHFLGGAMIVTLVTVFGGFELGVYALAPITVAAGVKEFWYDMKYELPKQTWADSAMDFVFYFLGALVAVGVMLVAHHLGRVS
jgi:hypothetical protein